MTTINIIGKTTPVQIPSAWHELTSKQVQFIYEQYFYLLRHQQQDLFYDRLLCYFVPKKLQRGTFTRKFKEKKNEIYHNAAELTPVLFDWLWKYDGETLHYKHLF